MFRDTVSQTSRQALQLIFEFARHDAEFLSTLRNSTSAPANTQGDRLAIAAASAIKRVAALQVQLDQIDQQMLSSATSRPILAARRDKLVSQLNLAKVRRESCRTSSTFAAEGGGGTLVEQIGDLEKSVPEVHLGEEGGAASQPAAPDGNSAQEPTRVSSMGIVGLVEEMVSLTRRLGDVDGLTKRTEKLREQAERRREPIRPSFSTRFTTVMPCRRYAIPMIPIFSPPSGRTWIISPRDSSFCRRRPFRSARTAPFWTSRIRALLGGAMQSPIISSRPAVSHDPPRGDGRGHFHSVDHLEALVRGYVSVRDGHPSAATVPSGRRLVVGGIVMLILVAGFVTEFGSLATYAGLLTAGIAVALQSVILSGVAHFLGRYGVRVGDRVTISGITGDVIDTGIFRLYMMELGGKNGDFQPTGRIVIFSNSVLFQPNAFYKQIPARNTIGMKWD